MIGPHSIFGNLCRVVSGGWRVKRRDLGGSAKVSGKAPNEAASSQSPRWGMVYELDTLPRKENTSWRCSVRCFSAENLIRSHRPLLKDSVETLETLVRE